jgi:hypothetical protein
LAALQGREMICPARQFGLHEELAQAIAAVASGLDRDERVDVEEALRGERLGRVAAVAGLHREGVERRNGQAIACSPRRSS